MADLARQEFTAVLMEIESAWHSEGRRMASRAAWLNNESADQFEKVSPVALQRMQSDGQSSSYSSREQSQDVPDYQDDVDDVSTLSMSF